MPTSANSDPNQMQQPDVRELYETWEYKEANEYLHVGWKLISWYTNTGQWPDGTRVHYKVYVLGWCKAEAPLRPSKSEETAKAGEKAA